jgi:signal transduction histidine kinase
VSGPLPHDISAAVDATLPQFGNPDHDAADRALTLEASEARHRDLADVASDWLWETNADHRFTFISKRFAETSGIPWALIAGRRLDDLVELGFEPAGMHALRATIDARCDFHDAVYRVAPVGQAARFWQLSGKPFVDPDTARFAGYRGTGTDITVRIERETALNEALRRAELAEQEARQARERLVDAIEAIPEGFVLHDAQDRLVMCNTHYGKIYGLPEELMRPGIRFEEVVRGSVIRGTFAQDQQALDDWVAERIARHRSPGSPHADQQLSNGRWLRVVERRTGDGGIVGIRIDVTEARQREAAERERGKLAALGYLARGAAHEINNLLQPALVLPAMVRDRLPEGDAESREDLDFVVDAVRKASGIIRDIGIFARHEEPVLTPLDLSQELRATLGFVRDLMRPAVVVREANLDAFAGCLVAANKSELIQVMTNLLANAAQATRGTATATISLGRIEPSASVADRLSIEPGRSYLTVGVADTGSGMDETTRARVFEPFFTTKPVGTAIGLGLSVVHGIVRSWHGAVTVDSEPGMGSTFTLYLPIVPA